MIRIESRFRLSHCTHAPAMTRLRFSFSPTRLSTRFCSVALLAATLGVAWSPQNVRADEFSLLPLGDPIYSQLSSLTRPSDAKETKNASLTRYEAALQAARAILDVQNREPKAVTRANWRAIKALCTSLKSELRQLGVDVEDALALAERGLKTDAPLPAASSSAGTSSARTASGATRANALAGGLPLSGPSLANRNSRTSAIEIPLSQRVRASASVTAQPSVASNAPGAALAGSPSALAPTNSPGSASQSGLAFDWNPYLTLHAATSQNRLDPSGNRSPLFLGPLFQGATTTDAASGGVALKLGALQLSTEVGRLSTDTGASAARFGGGASLSALQNRLSLGMNLQRLVPQDNAILPSTSAEVNLGLDLTQRFRLNLLYQGLFAQAASNSASRVSGGVSLSF